MTNFDNGDVYWEVNVHIVLLLKKTTFEIVRWILHISHEPFLWQGFSVGTSIFYPFTLTLEFDLLLNTLTLLITFEQWMLELSHFTWEILVTFLFFTLSSSSPLCQSQSKLVSCVKRIQVYSNERQALFQGEIITKKGYYFDKIKRNSSPEPLDLFNHIWHKASLDGNINSSLFKWSYLGWGSCAGAWSYKSYSEMYYFFKNLLYSQA